MEQGDGGLDQRRRTFVAGLASGLATLAGCTNAGSTPSTPTDWWDDRWGRRRPVDVFTADVPALEDYPVATEPIDIGRVSFDSLRLVSESGELVPFGIEDTTDDFGRGDVRLAFPVTATASDDRRRYELYYENSDAAPIWDAWDRHRYTFGDRFEDDTLDDRWQVHRSNTTRVAFENGILRVRSLSGKHGTRLLSQSYPARGTVQLETRYRYDHPYDVPGRILGLYEQPGPDTKLVELAIRTDFETSRLVVRTNEGSRTLAEQWFGKVPAPGTWQTYAMTVDLDAGRVTQVSRGDVTFDVSIDVSEALAAQYQFGSWTDNSAREQYDYLGLRPLVDPAPRVRVGELTNL